MIPIRDPRQKIKYFKSFDLAAFTLLSELLKNHWNWRLVGLADTLQGMETSSPSPTAMTSASRELQIGRSVGEQLSVIVLLHYLFLGITEYILFYERKKRQERCEMWDVHNFMGKINIHTLFKSIVMLHHSKCISVNHRSFFEENHKILTFHFYFYQIRRGSSFGVLSDTTVISSINPDRAAR